MPNFIALGQTMYEKSVTIFTPFSILEPQGDPLHQSSPIWMMTYSKSFSIKLPNFVPFRKSLYRRYLLPKFVDFVDDVTFILTKNSKRCRPPYSLCITVR